MTFRAWNIIAKPGDMSFDGMMHCSRMATLSNKWYSKHFMWLIGKVVERYHANPDRYARLIRYYITFRRLFT